MGEKYITYSNKGEKITAILWDWCCMFKVIQDYKDELNITDEEAYDKFWEDVKNYDKKEFEHCIAGKTIYKAMCDNDRLDMLRAKYLQSLDIKYEIIKC